jgi:TetR/AcrR family transcriptional regulator, transcriptional repressor of aconitase
MTFRVKMQVMPKVSERYRDARREQILDAARRCFLRDGFHATSMQDLFREAGLSSGAVYRYFSSKDDLIIAIAERNMRDMAAMLRTVAQRDAEPVGLRGAPVSLGEALSTVIDLVTEKHEKEGLGGLAVQVWAESLRNPALAARYAELMRGLRAELAEVIERRQQTGDLPGGVSPDALARTLIALFPGYIVQYSVLGPNATKGFTETLRALWPAAGGSSEE